MNFSQKKDPQVDKGEEQVNKFQNLPDEIQYFDEEEKNAFIAHYQGAIDVLKEKQLDEEFLLQLLNGNEKVKSLEPPALKDLIQEACQ